MRKFLVTKKFFQKIFKKFRPLTPRTKKLPAADREEKIEIFQPLPPIAYKFFSSRRRERPRLTLLAVV
jgi:hypothetical protein